MEWVFAILGAILSLGVGIMLRKLDNAEKKRQTSEEQRQVREDEQAKSRQEESILIMRHISAVGHLSEATAIAIKTHRVNGKMDKALEYYQEAKDDINVYLLKQNAKVNHS